MKMYLIIVLVSLVTFNLHAQINLSEKIKRQTQNRADRKTDEGINDGLDAVEGVFKKKDKKEDAKPEAAEPEATPEKAKDVKQQENPAVSFASFSKYDFVPGEQVLFYEDFSQDEIGDFPDLWTTDGSGEVKTTNLFQGKFLHMNTTDKFYNLMKDLDLPQNFILEFDVIPTCAEEHSGSSSSFYITLYNDDEEEFLNTTVLPGTTGFHLIMNTYKWEATSYKDGNYSVTGGSELAPLEQNKLNHVIIWVQNRRVRAYHKGQKTLDLPTLLPANTSINRLRFGLWSQDGLPFVTNIRFTTAAPDMRNKLITEGKLISYGIYFDVNSDKVKNESYGSIKQIADVLQENPNVRIKIIGHTDSDGDDAKNLDLSKRRSASVKNELVNTFKIVGSRIETDGKGEGEPVSPNITPEGKAKNRRVEFIKL
jgi:OmpA-OmpF porin, OOP family